MISSPTTTIPVEHLRHQDKRVNIPTEELRDFVAEDEQSNKHMVYLRDPSLDPQLAWKGKDEQDQEPLAVPTVPIYIQEKIHPQALIEEVRAQAKKEKPEMQMDLFGDFNGLGWADLVDFYHHEQNWTNRLILGDSLLVMNSLAEKEGLKGQVQMIYMDPPYGIKFGSNWQVSTRKRDVKDGSAADATRQPEQIKAFRDTWELGIHSYLRYLRDRLVVARELLTDSGSVFVQIGDENIHLVRCLLDEVFGSENFVSLISFQKTGGLVSRGLVRTVDYVCWYAKSSEQVKIRQLYLSRQAGDTSLDRYDTIHTADGQCRRLTSEERLSGMLPDGARRCRQVALESANPTFPFEYQGRTFTQRWKTNQRGLSRLSAANRLAVAGTRLNSWRYVDDFPVIPLTDRWESMQIGTELVYVVQTAITAIQNCILMTTDPGDLVLDPTCGSGTTVYVAEQWGRRWITIDTSRVAMTLARTRLMGARFPYYLLADSPEGLQREAEITGQLPPVPLPKTEGDVRKGFVYRRVPHITLKSIANNEEIDGMYGRWQEKLDAHREQLRSLLGMAWEEWEVPQGAESSWPSEAHALLAKWWEMRRERQKEIDESIARRADTETLYDQPYEDTRRVRVTGPFTVESLSPHRTLSVDDKITEGEECSEIVPGMSLRMLGSNNFAHTIVENLRKVGVQNTKRDERLKFETLEPFAGEWIQAAGEHIDKYGQLRRMAVALGPEYGTVGPELVKEAAKEALKGIGFDLLIVCGFAFDAHAGETAKEVSPNGSGAAAGFAVEEATRQYGKLPVLLARINPDLAMGDELLKKTGAGNLFMAFGEPDVLVERSADGKVVLEIRGVDVYDPTTGEIRSSSTDDIACWFVDTDYNEESFFVRHAYFTGAGDPYDKLKRALRADIDEAAWSSLYATRSRPFDAPSRGKVAVKVINHYGDEVMKVFDISANKYQT